MARVARAGADRAVGLSQRRDSVSHRAKGHGRRTGGRRGISRALRQGPLLSRGAGERSRPSTDRQRRSHGNS